MTGKRSTSVHLTIAITHLLLPPGGESTTGNSWWGCAARFSKSWPYFRPKNVIYHTRFLTWPLGRNYVIITKLERKQKILQIHFELAYFSFFLTYSFGIETIKTLIHARSSLENHTRFQTKMGKAYTRFQTKTTQKPYPIGRHIPHPRAIADHVTSTGDNMKCSLLHSRF